jgi:hypothetical protein
MHTAHLLTKGMEKKYIGDSHDDPSEIYLNIYYL